MSTNPSELAINVPEYTSDIVLSGASNKCGNAFGRATMPHDQVQAIAAVKPANNANDPSANINAKPSGIHSQATHLDNIERISHDVQTAQVPPVQTGSVLSEGLGMACNAMSAKLNTPEINQIVSQDPANSNPDLNRAPEMLQPDEVIHTHRANFDLTNNSGPSMGGMSM